MYTMMKTLTNKITIEICKYSHKVMFPATKRSHKLERQNWLTQWLSEPTINCSGCVLYFLLCIYGTGEYIYNLASGEYIKTHDSESRGQEEAQQRDQEEAQQRDH